MLVSVCGAQGCGKTTFLNKLQSKGIDVVERKTVRSILSDWNMPISEIYNDLNLLQKFQQAVLERKYQDEALCRDDDVLHATERGFIDLFAFTLTFFGNKNNYSSWLNDYADQCFSYQKNYIGSIYIQSGRFGIVDDGVRPTNVYYSKLIDTIINQYVGEYSTNLLKLDSNSDEEVDVTLTFIDNILNSKGNSTLLKNIPAKFNGYDINMEKIASDMADKIVTNNPSNPGDFQEWQ